jgi:23S rRNA-/tRNA-specific pseudouridylate synthase
VCDKRYGGGKPVIVYGGKFNNIGAEEDAHPIFSRAGLHSWSLKFVHPLSHEEHTFFATYPMDFSNALNALRTES